MSIKTLEFGFSNFKDFNASSDIKTLLEGMPYYFYMAETCLNIVLIEIKRDTILCKISQSSESVKVPIRKRLVEFDNLPVGDKFLWDTINKKRIYDYRGKNMWGFHLIPAKVGDVSLTSVLSIDKNGELHRIYDRSGTTSILHAVYYTQTTLLTPKSTNNIITRSGFLSILEYFNKVWNTPQISGIQEWEFFHIKEHLSTIKEDTEIKSHLFNNFCRELHLESELKSESKSGLKSSNVDKNWSGVENKSGRGSEDRNKDNININSNLLSEIIENGIPFSRTVINIEMDIPIQGVDRMTAISGILYVYAPKVWFDKIRIELEQFDDNEIILISESIKPTIEAGTGVAEKTNAIMEVVVERFKDDEIPT